MKGEITFKFSQNKVHLKKKMASATIVSLFLSSVCLFPLAASLERSAPRQDMSSYLNMDTV